MTLRDMKHDVCETVGFYDTFSIKQAIYWLQQPPQQVRDAVRELEREGIVERIGRGLYKWTGK